MPNSKLFPKTSRLAFPADPFAHRFGPRFEKPGDGDVDMNALTDEQIKLVATQIEANVNAAMKPITATLTKLNDGFVAINERLEKLSESKGDDDKDKPDPKDGDNPQIAALLEQLQKQNERLDAIDDEKQTATATAEARKLAEAIVEKNHPGMTKERKALIVDRIAAAGPKSEDDANAARESAVAEFKAMGIEEKAFGADPKGEGAEDPPKTETEDQIAERRIKEITTTTGGVGLVDRSKPTT